MRFVLDASVALVWHFTDEGGDKAEYIAQRAFDGGVIVPQHWFIEVANGLVRGERRQRSTPENSARYLDQLNDFDVAIDVLEVDRVASVLVPLARLERLSVYDAAYLELASRLQVALATLDGPLSAAARRLNIQLIEGE